MVIERKNNLRITFSDEEHEMARALAEADGITINDLVRRNVRKAFAKKFGGKPKGATAPKPGGKR